MAGDILPYYRSQRAHLLPFEAIGVSLASIFIANFISLKFHLFYIKIHLLINVLANLLQCLQIFVSSKIHVYFRSNWVIGILKSHWSKIPCDILYNFLSEILDSDWLIISFMTKMFLVTFCLT